MKVIKITQTIILLHGFITFESFYYFCVFVVLFSVFITFCVFIIVVFFYYF